jgi:nucleotide-binding universal stress UspA family protein
MKTLNAGTRVMVKNILFATDFSPFSRKALRYAMAVARRFGSKIYGVHVITPGAYQSVPPEIWAGTREVIEDAARAEMEKLGKDLQGVPHQLMLRHGMMWETLEETIERAGIDFMVMGTHGRTGFERLLLGSVAEEVFRQAPCPVLTVGPHAPAEPPGENEFSRVIYATDFSSESVAALPYAISFAQEYQARLTMLRAITRRLEPIEEISNLVPASKQRLEEMLPAGTDLWCEPEFEVRFGRGGEEIVNEAKQKAANLIVLGVKGPRGLVVATTHVTPATAHYVVAHAECPVLTVRG